METQEYIESGILELYVFGLLSEDENREVNKMAIQHKSVETEILSIEKAIIDLSYVASPHLSSANYDKIRQQLIEKHAEPKVAQLQPKRGITPYLGWAAAILLMLGMGIQYYKYNQANEELNKVNVQSLRFQELLANLEKTNSKNETALTVLRDKNNKVIPLAGQEVAPNAYATVYMNADKNEVYVDISGLPKAPQGKAYQVWALKFDPLTPNSIGVLSDAGNTSGVFKVDNFDGVEGFGITLEPAGGSKTPTLEQLYTLGQI